jgi:hypothetical protein
LWSEEGEVRAGFRGVMCAQDGVVPLLTKAIQLNQLRRNEVIPIQVYPEKYNQRVHDKEWPTQRIQQLEEQPQGVHLELLDVQLPVVNQRGTRERLEVETHILRPLTQRSDGAVPNQIGYALLGGRYL